MGIHKEDIERLLKYIKSVYGDKYENLSMLELGNQGFFPPDADTTLNIWKKYLGDKWHTLTPRFRNNQNRRRQAKLFFEILGFKHTSFDMNETWGAINVDLSVTFKEIKEQFNIITNYGTSEHVGQYCMGKESYENPQYNCFKNIHNLLKVGGICFHAVPAPNKWPKHGLFEYDLKFFETLAKKNNYKILDAKYINNYNNFNRISPYGTPWYSDNTDNYYNCDVVLQKLDDSEFITLDEFNNIEGIINTNFYGEKS